MSVRQAQVGAATVVVTAVVCVIGLPLWVVAETNNKTIMTFIVFVLSKGYVYSSIEVTNTKNDILTIYMKYLVKSKYANSNISNLKPSLGIRFPWKILCI